MSGGGEENFTRAGICWMSEQPFFSENRDFSLILTEK